jgi:hypothetical protein
VNGYPEKAQAVSGLRRKMRRGAQMKRDFSLLFSPVPGRKALAQKGAYNRRTQSLCLAPGNSVHTYPANLTRLKAFRREKPASGAGADGEEFRGQLHPGQIADIFIEV